MWNSPRRSVSLVIVIAGAMAAATCGQTETVPTAPSSVPSRNGSETAPAPPTVSTAGRLEVTINPNPVPYSGQPITDVASCRERPHTWFYEQTLREVGGVAITVTGRVDSFDGAPGSTSNPNLRIAANGSTTIRTRWCSSSPSAHTAQTNFSGTDASGRSWTLTGPVVRLLAR